MRSSISVVKACLGSIQPETKAKEYSQTLPYTVKGKLHTGNMLWLWAEVVEVYIVAWVQQAQRQMLTH